MLLEKKKNKKNIKVSRMQKLKNSQKPEEIIRVSFDEAFCIMFGSPDHLSILTSLLSKILQVKYEELDGKITLIPRSVPNETTGEYLTERDVVVKIDTNEKKKVLLEVNIRSSFYNSVINRNIHYLEEEAVSGIPQNISYEDLPIVILVNFNNFSIHNNGKIFDEYLYRNEDGEILSDIRRILNINIEKCYQICYNGVELEEELNSYERDLLLLSAALWTTSKKEFKYAIEQVEIDEKIKVEIMEVLVRMNENASLVRKYRDYKLEEERTEKGIRNEILAEGKEIGLEEGRKQKEQEMVTNLYNQNVSIDIISKASGLSQEEIEEIINNSKSR